MAHSDRGARLLEKETVREIKIKGWEGRGRGWENWSIKRILSKSAEEKVLKLVSFDSLRLEELKKSRRN